MSTNDPPPEYTEIIDSFSEVELHDIKTEDMEEHVTQDPATEKQTDNNHTENGQAAENASVPKSKTSKRAALRQMVRPCLREANPLPENPTIVDKIKDMFLLPPQGMVGFILQITIICLQIWGILAAITGSEALPGGNFFSLIVLFVLCVICGRLISFANLPPLLGMLIAGVFLRNVPGIKIIGESIDPKWSGQLRKLALTVILLRAGLGLDIVKLRKLSFAVLRLAFIPCLSEAITGGIVSHFLLGFPWAWSLMLGCILAALSPAVTVPSLVSLQERRYGIAKGIPTMCLAAGGLDNVLCVTGFAVFVGIIFSEGDLAVTIVKGPLGVLLGIGYGFVAGIMLWFLPGEDSTNSLFYRGMLLFGSGMIAIFGSSAVGLSGAGPLGCLTTATVAAYRWRQERQPGEPDELGGIIALAWLIVQHFLFGLIGAAVDIGNIQPNTAGLGIATLFIGLCVRSAVSFSVTLGTGFNIKERIFITLTWLSKATVQAAIGGLALDKALEGDNEEDIRMGTDVLTIAVLAIVICAPVGATCMGVLGPRFLEHGDEEEIRVECSGSAATSSNGKCQKEIEIKTVSETKTQ
ncbi:sodium/hydrogen exchanger 9B2-like [Saccostrea echinata]|uniref:sodium/hydrogen exchanger 9B2-like n=1 Tax=Saccostrea echinata TaxID=191078 RepID=UPI002A7F3936|nr:sodium/hydrogen exchanger 9B2-like [Saccostrea echinata]